MGFAICEGSVVYDLYPLFFNSGNGDAIIIDCLLDKNINHISFCFPTKRTIFASLHNKNKEDDKFFILKDGNQLEEFVIDIVPCDARVINITSSCGFATYFHLGLFFKLFLFHFHVK